MFRFIAATIVTLGCTHAVFANDRVIKECSVTNMQLNGDKIVSTNIQIIYNYKTGVYAKIQQGLDGNFGEYSDTALISAESVRENLSRHTEPVGLNHAEGLIVHAMRLSEDPMFNGEYSAGLDLSKVRSAKMYTVGEMTNMGSTTIVEAKDADDKVLGSFLGGFLVSPCK